MIETPNGWRLAAVGDLAERMKSGGTPSRAKPNYWGRDIPFALIEDITESGLFLGTTREKITSEGLENSSAWIVPPGSVLLSMYATIGATSVTEIPTATNQAILGIVPKADVDPVFLAFALRYHAPELIRRNVQSTQKNIGKGIVERFVIAIPEFDEQREIGRSLAAIEAAHKASKVTERALNDLFVSLLVRALPSAEGEVPPGWSKVELRDAIDGGPQNGVYRPQSDYGRGVLIVRIADYPNQGGLVSSAEHRVQLDLDDIGRYSLQTGDLLVNRVNSIPFVGKTALIGDLQEPLVFESNMMRLRPNPDVVIPEFLFRSLCAPHIRDQMQARAKRAIGQASINQEDVVSLRISVPTLQRQSEIVRMLGTIETRISAERVWRARLEDLSRTLLTDLMSGKKRIPRGESWNA